MKKSLLFALQIFLFTGFLITLMFAVLRVSGISNPLSKRDHDEMQMSRKELYDAGLARLNNLQKLTAYCDSLYTASYQKQTSSYQKDYTNLVSQVIRRRFYHGYSYYGFNDNYLAFLFSKISNQGYSAIVKTDDILKHPMGSCSQQSIVMMQLLENKGFQTRKIGFHGKKYGGHFCLEVFYNNSWHFYDANLEPDSNVLAAYDRPGIDSLVANMPVLLKAYSKNNEEEIMDIFPTYKYGAVNVFPAPNALLFHKVTNFLSYTIWIFFFIAFVLVRRLSRRLTNTQYVWNSRIHFPPVHPGTSTANHHSASAQGS